MVSFRFVKFNEVSYLKAFIKVMLDDSNGFQCLKAEDLIELEET